MKTPRTWKPLLFAALALTAGLASAGPNDLYFKAEPYAAKDDVELSVSRIKLTPDGEVWIKLNVKNKSKGFVFVDKDKFSVALAGFETHRKARLPLGSTETLKPGEARSDLDLRFPFSKSMMKQAGIDTVKELVFKPDGISKAASAKGNKAPLALPAWKATRLGTDEAAKQSSTDTAADGG